MNIMRSPILYLGLGLLLLGCGASGPDSVGGNGPKGLQALAGIGTSGAAYGRQQTQHASIGTLPDRGELVRYDSVRTTQKDGVRIAYPVSFSEAHAFSAIANGELVVRTPDGERLRLKTRGHEEYADGNWTLTARDAAGTEALLTFGQDAVFGSITRSNGGQLRITTRQRQVYVLVVDPSRLAHVDVRRLDEGSDMLLPPVRLAAANPLRAAAAGQVPALAGASVANTSAGTIDILLAYTNGLAARVGSASGAETLMQNRVAVANEAYGNSGITMRLRLVRAMQVNYPDDTDNRETLQKLTGSSGSGPLPVDPAFNGLRAAREETGADLVALVRQFREPENDGCGIAWLLGGGQTTITPEDAAFAYSVVSDGSDVRESDGKTYFCRDETLAHEVGHNMGQAHNIEDSNSAGAHAYSYGYREASGTGFFTIMAYRLTDSSQLAIRHFANPEVSYAGRPTGVAGQSDNARSMNQTMPIIAAFRQTVVPAPAPLSMTRNDIDNDGKSDFIWYQPVFQRLATWKMDGNMVVRHGDQATGSGYRVMTTGDYNGDGRVDLIWLGVRGDMQLWQGNGTTFDWRPFFMYPGGWDFVGSADLDADGKADLIWYNPGSRTLATWKMDGNVIVQHGSQATGVGYRVIALGDYNGDRRVDLVWLGIGGDMQLWQGNGTTFDWRPFYMYPGSSWELVGSADSDADGKTDLIWHNPALGQVAVWKMDGNVVARHGGQPAGPGYRIITTGDYNGDGRADLVWLGTGGDMQLWQGNGTTFDCRPLYMYPPGWTLASATL